MLDQLKPVLTTFGQALTTYQNNLLSGDTVTVAATAGIAAITMLAAAAFIEYRNDRQVGDDTNNGAINTVMELNPTEMHRLSNTQFQFDRSMAGLMGEVEPTRVALCQAEQQLRFRDSLANSLPNCLGRYIGNAERAQTVDNLREQVRRKEVEMETESRKASAVQEQRSLMQRIARLEGSLPTLVERAQSAGQEVTLNQENLEAAWNSLSLRQRIVYYTPTALLRSIVSNVLLTDRDQVDEAVEHNRGVRRHNYLQSQNQTSISGAYQGILKAMRENIHLEGSQIHDRLSAHDVLSAYSLACQLKSKAKEAQSTISSYRIADGLATAAELRAGWSFGRSEEDQRDADSTASNARTYASLLLADVSDRLNETQNLSGRLEAALKTIQGHVGKIDTSGIDQHQLDRASSSMWDYNWNEIFFGMNTVPIFNILHNLSEWENNDRITEIVEQIGHSAQGIQGELQEPAVRIFVRERSLLREQQPDQMTDSNEFRNQTVTYLQSW